MRVYLVGFMGVGKSTVGEELARRLGVDFVDLDREVERSAGSPVAEIFDRQGEPEFRRLETRALSATRQLSDAVIALGGGTLAAPENRRATEGGTTVWLDLPLAAILERLGPATGAELQSLPGDQARVFSVAFSPDGRYAAVYNKGISTVYHLVGDKLVLTGISGESIKWRRDGRYVVANNKGIDKLDQPRPL